MTRGWDEATRRYARPMGARATRLLSVVAAIAAVVLFTAAVVAWHMRSPWPYCPPNAECAAPPPPHHLHPLRAEALWVMSGAFALVAAASAAHPRPPPAPAGCCVAEARGQASPPIGEPHGRQLGQVRAMLAPNMCSMPA